MKLRRIILASIVFAVGLFNSAFGGEVQKPQKFISNSAGMDFVYIEPGEFDMGSRVNRDEKKHDVMITKGFYMQTTETTIAHWKRVMGSAPEGSRDCPYCPVEMTSWLDAVKFADRLNRLEGVFRYRLPTEAEWEYAARAGRPSGIGYNELRKEQANFMKRTRQKGVAGGTTPVAAFAPNPWGLYDMQGNVWEWCRDRCEKNDAARPGNEVKTWTYVSGVADPIGMRGDFRIVRGGAWYSWEKTCRPENRYLAPKDFRAFGLGFRLVKEID